MGELPPVIESPDNQMYPLPYVLMTVFLKDPAPVNEHMLGQAQAMAQQCGATLQTNRQPAPGPVKYLTAFDETGSFVAYKLEVAGELPKDPWIKSAADPYKSWTLKSSFVVNVMRGSSNWDKIEYAMYPAGADQPSMTSQHDLPRQNQYGNFGMNYGACLPNDIGHLYNEMMNMVSCMSSTAPDERVLEQSDAA